MNKTKKTKKSVSVFSVLLAAVLLFATLSTCLTVTVSAENAVPDGEWKNYTAAFAGGTGAENDPYLIATEEQLAYLSVNVAGGERYKGKWFKLTDDLDLSAHRWNPIGQYKWETSDTTDNYFSGNFDGNGKKICGIYVDEEKDGFSGGLFGNIKVTTSNTTIEIRDITVENAVLFGNETDLVSGYNGILCSTVMANESSRIIIKNVSVSGSMDIEYTSGEYICGGMCGSADRVTFVDCTVDSIRLNGASNSGGFVGMASEDTFTDCIARGTVNGLWAIGGFVGYSLLSDDTDGSKNSTFTRCVADVNVKASDWNVGGFCGYSVNAVFKKCAAFGDVESTVADFEPRVAGFLGYSSYAYDGYTGAQPVRSVLNDCYFGGKVTSAHPTILPSAVVASINDSDVITGCCYNAEKNTNVNVFSENDGTAVTSFTAEAKTSAELLNYYCDGAYGHHQYEGNTCKICGLEMVYINTDGYWVIDGKVTDVKAKGEQGENGENGEQGEQGLQGEKGNTGSDGTDGNAASNGLAVTAAVIGGIALVGNIVLVVYIFAEKKKRSENK